VYLKYWKGRGVTCTSDTSDKSNIITAGRFDLFPQRLFTVGRLDKDSTGIILLTSDGRVNNAMLSPAVKKEKVSWKATISVSWLFILLYKLSLIFTCF
jgi:16S rRNA U516 pseudouridylate synthase RsuA-like enzyme